ncbi:MAG: hypothetical protein R3358_07430 [Woeseiaceae bacterium]|nr:hypothetical protein [Woeseiaceae bacterium]
MIKTAYAVTAAFLCVACTGADDAVVESVCDRDAETVVAAMVEAHGGMSAWQSLESLYVEREHLFAGRDQPIRFNIHGEYPSHRIFQTWQAPAGTLAWDGERAWSSGWPLAAQLMPRYVAGIGFYLVNMPWLAHAEASMLESMGCGSLPDNGDREYLVIHADYEPDPVRKPAWFDGPRDSYELYIDPDTYRLSGVMQHWTYAGRLDSAKLPASVTAISQLFVPDTYVEVDGLLLPHSYTAYTPEFDVAATGRFFDYDFSRPFDADLLLPAEPDTTDWDTSSSYHRAIE